MSSETNNCVFIKQNIHLIFHLHQSFGNMTHWPTLSDSLPPPAGKVFIQKVTFVLISVSFRLYPQDGATFLFVYDLKCKVFVN